jgi:L-malate glycosyltransferase
VKIGIYNEPARGGIGGSEISVAVLAEALAARNEVEIIHHKAHLTRRDLAEVSATDLEAVQMRLVCEEPYEFGSVRSPAARFKKARNWRAALSEPYEMFINFTHGIPPFCHAPAGMLMVLFPFHERPSLEIEKHHVHDAFLWKQLKGAYHSWEWNERLKTYQLKAANSRFSREWATRRWGVDCEIIYPPVDTTVEPRDKSDVILSVGRFTASGHSKKQLEMLTAYESLGGSRRDWKYVTVGGVSPAIEDQKYFEEVSRRASDCCATAMANVEHNELKELYGRAKVFWHGAGYGESENCPELSEHFGIATVEAMSAGCVPIVINRGAQPEIVEHGISGFVWNTFEELGGYTEQVMCDERLRLEMSKAARGRASDFSRARFVERFDRLVGV